MLGGAAVADGMCLFHAVLSYCGEVIITVVSDRDALADPAPYTDCIRASFAEMLSATTTSTPRRTSKKRRATATQP